jgi:hypothetical protein
VEKFPGCILISLLPPEDPASKDVEEIDTASRKVKKPSFAGASGDTSCSHDQPLRNVSAHRD